MKKAKIRVVCAMSGGVDSSVAAALLKKQGYDVIGVFMRFWKGPGQGENRCCSPESQVRARQTAAKLGMPFYVFNFEKEFKKRIVDYFLREYKDGRTPNPCVVCNKEIKFGLLLEKALALGADYIATGHYARIKSANNEFNTNIRINEFVDLKQIRYSLISGRDKEKDQSYFLWQLKQNQLRHILFPVGDYTKTEVRKLAKKFELPNFAAPDSQEICFVPKTINDFLEKYIKQKRGDVVDVRGKILGKHHGLAFYTIGQRKGIGLAGGPYWVLDKDLKKNHLIITKNEKDLLKKELIFKNANWISGKPPKFPFRVKAKIRYRSNFIPGVIYRIQDTRYKIIFSRPQRAITPGQSVVFYSPAEARRAKEGKGVELLGGGIIC